MSSKGITEQGSAVGAWSQAELAVLVGGYFQMLADDLAGRPYSKAEHRRRMKEFVGRSDGSIEFKLQNVSAVLNEFGIPWIPGYKPRRHYQDALVAEVWRQLPAQSNTLLAAAARPRALPPEGPLLLPPPEPLDASEDQQPTILRRLVGKFDPAKRDARNRALGKAGESLVVDFERARLRRAGLDKLAEGVRWVSDLDGDGFGYDVLSFELDGQERLLEVKTTCGHERTPFWLTRREVDVAAERPDVYRIRRVFHFRNQVGMFDIAPPLKEALHMVPTTFIAAPL